MLKALAAAAAAAADEVGALADRLAKIHSAKIAADLSDDIRRGQAPELLEVLEQKLGLNR